MQGLPAIRRSLPSFTDFAVPSFPMSLEGGIFVIDVSVTTNWSSMSEVATSTYPSLYTRCPSSQRYVSTFGTGRFLPLEIFREIQCLFGFRIKFPVVLIGQQLLWLVVFSHYENSLGVCCCIRTHGPCLSHSAQRLHCNKYSFTIFQSHQRKTEPALRSEQQRKTITQHQRERPMAPQAFLQESSRGHYGVWKYLTMCRSQKLQAEAVGETDAIPQCGLFGEHSQRQNPDFLSSSA